jgi:hypothetical protein
MKTRNIATLLFICLLSFPLLSQKLDRVQGEVLVMLEADTDVRGWSWQFKTFEGRKSHFKINKIISRPLNIWSFKFDHNTINENHILEAIWRQPEVKMAQFNHLIEMRTTVPDDTQFNDQWQYINTGQNGGTPGVDLDADLAWDITTGGVTAFGDTIVVCVIDSGIDLNHQDFENNLWLNHKEIPDNDIDDDNNGYVDDYFGWNTAFDNDDIAGSNHGTAVAGIVGAKGNNELGVTGISWNVKMMVIKNTSTSEGSVLEAYSYPLTQRKLYNESNGEEGDFVVATNASWGVNMGLPEDSPLWCAMYDSLGVHGIINCGATANLDLNVDEEGDLPTTCTSDFLISVTNVNRFDEKVTGSGYGATSIDLGAFGEGVWTTSIGNSYNAFGGTSGATPHVTGAIGLLYSAPCEGFISLAKSAPAAAALLMKQVILEGVDHNESLEGITATEGRLNINNSLLLLMENCGGCFPPVTLSAHNIGVSTADIKWAQSDSVLRVDARWRLVGEDMWMEGEDVGFPLELTDLEVCSDYEVQLKGFCQSDTLDFTPSYFFSTSGCCEPPSIIEITEITDETITIQWNEVLTANGYIIEYREPGAITWFSSQAFSNGIMLSDLTNCTEYEFRLRTHCNDDGENGEIQSFLTTGCGECADTEYCVPEALNAASEWIEQFSFGSIENTSGTNGSYGNFTLLESAVFEQGQSYTMSITPVYDGFAYSEDVHLYIDYDHDGEFEEEELLFALEETINSTFSTSIEIPVDALVGLSRLRVVMQFQEVDGPCPGGFQEYGEVEDYCVTITQPDAVDEIGFINNWKVQPNPFTNHIDMEFDFSVTANFLFIKLQDQTGRILQSHSLEQLGVGKQNLRLDVEQLPQGLYFINIMDSEGNMMVKKVVKS